MSAEPQTLPPDFQTRILTVHQGDCTLSGDPQVTLSTVLGSCISACIRDVAAGVGGMNHFLLAAPGEGRQERFGVSARYGAFAMEQLINGVLSAGSGQRRNLEVKVFGGGRMSPGLADIGAANIRFLRDFLATERLPVAAEDLGQGFARRVLFKPASGRVLVRRLDHKAAEAVTRDEIRFVHTAPPKPRHDDIELF